MAMRTKNRAAVELGRLGGKKGGPARAVSMTPEERQECARKAGTARMEKLTALQRSEMGRKAIQARWNKDRGVSATDITGPEQLRTFDSFDPQAKRPKANVADPTPTEEILQWLETQLYEVNAIRELLRKPQSGLSAPNFDLDEFALNTKQLQSWLSEPVNRKRIDTFLTHYRTKMSSGAESRGSKEGSKGSTS
jgi:hypothetical protein